ncbi:MAG: hypothetical protein Q9174_004250, partial [Haloplaca sp. 1 TL-2023]
MPKGGGKGGTSKKPDSNINNQDDGDYIVFGDGKPKKAKKSTSKDTDVKSQEDTNPSGQEAPKKPDARQLIGGASWTGKLPMTLLSEHCQKQKWAKPEYTMSKTSSGFLSTVILKSTDPKTKELTTLPPFLLPPSYKAVAAQPSAVEARHFAATYALFRVCNMRNIHMMLPPNYRDLWKTEFESSKKDDVQAGRKWMYEADPFLAKQKQDEANALKAKKRADEEKSRSQASNQSVNIGSGSHQNGSRPNLATSKAWARAPKIELGKQTRSHIEQIIQRKTVWNPHNQAISQAAAQDIVRDLVPLGFRPSHVEEAISECRDREEVLEWLLIYVPEDDLPAWSLPEGYTAGISMASGNPKREATIVRLAEAGYSSDLCGRALDDCNGNEAFAAETLQKNLAIELSHNMSKPAIAELDSKAIWNEEKETLSAIFGERFRSLSDSIAEIQLLLQEIKPCKLRITIPTAYPHDVPVMALVSPNLPAYVRLSILRQGLAHTRSILVGEPMIFNLVDWYESEIPRIHENPGKLRDVSAAVTGVSQPRTMNERRQIPTRPKPLPIRWEPGTKASVDVHQRWLSRQDTPRQQKMMAARRGLPAWKHRDTIVQTVKEQQVTIISGETGSGKSTQSVQFILDDMIQRQLGSSANMVCTQPRRISALGLADRVSDERCAVIGDEIGYSIRGESKVRPGQTRITFVTTGVLLRRLQTSGGPKPDVLAALADISHVFIDEVHERSLDTDLLLVLLRDILPKRRDLKVILMSATLDAGVFEDYFRAAAAAAVGKVNVEGRTYPVEDCYLDEIIQSTGFVGRKQYRDSEETDGYSNNPDITKTIQSLGSKINYDLVANCVQYIDEQLGLEDGGILIFLPGVVEINRTLGVLRRLPDLHCLPLHASLLPSEQRRVFPPAPNGKRKVIAATNVAETSITIEDIVAVIDGGKVKETSYDPQNNMVKLEEVWASRAACKQRRGRAGRVRPGQCYKLYTRTIEARMAERPEPEIRRIPLEQLCLSVKAMGVPDVPTFLANALTPPETSAVGGAMLLLRRMGTLEGDELTALGRHLAMIPADLRCGKLMVYGATFGCFDACLTIAAILTARSPFVSPQDKREEFKAARTSFAPNQGDLICDLRAFEQWSEQKSHSNHRDMRLWCEQNFLSVQTLTDISSNRSQYLSSLQNAGFIPSHRDPSSTPSSLNAHNTNPALIRALIAGAFNPQLARIDFPDKKFASSVSGAVELDPDARTIKFFNQDNGRVFVHPSATLFDAQTFTNNSVYMSYFNKMATSK